MLDKISANTPKIVSTQEKQLSPVGGIDLGQQFNQFLKQAIHNLNEQQHTVDQLTEQFLRGDLTDVHQLLIESQKASIGLELTVQIRNKVIEAYQEIMRMQI